MRGWVLGVWLVVTVMTSCAWGAEVPAPPKNLLMNASFEYADPGEVWPYWWSCWRPDTTKAFAYRSEDTAYEGKRCICFNAYEDALVMVFSRYYRVQAGHTYTFSAYAKGKATGTIGMQWEYHAPGGKIIDKQGVTAPVQEEWTRFTATFTIPEGKDIRWVRLFPQLNGKGTVYLDAMQFEAGPVATAWSPTPSPHEQVRYEFPITITPADGVVDPHIATLDTTVGALYDEMWPPWHAFDGKLETYTVSNYPARRIPKDLVVRFTAPVTLTGMEIAYLIPEQSPTRDGYRVEQLVGTQWVPIPHALVLEDAVHQVARNGRTEDDPYPRWTLTFARPVTTRALRIYVEKILKAEDNHWPRPAFREIVFRYAGEK